MKTICTGCMKEIPANENAFEFFIGLRMENIGLFCVDCAKKVPRDNVEATRKHGKRR